MRNKMMTGAIIAVVLLSAAALFWYFSPSDVSIVRIDAPMELLIGQLGYLTVNLQNNASEDVNVTINVKNSFVDSKGVSLKGVWVVAYENLNYTSPEASNATDRPQKEVMLKPGSNSITYTVGYEVPGKQTVEVEIYQYGKLIDSRTIEINIPTPKISINLWSHKGVNGTHEINTVYGSLQLEGKGSARGIVVNVSVINELTNATVSTVTRTYSLNSEAYVAYSSQPLVVWEYRNSTSDPVTGMETKTFIENIAPIVVIELSKGKPSAEKYIMSPVVIKDKIGDRYRVVVTARWIDQIVSFEMKIPSPYPLS
ncbi:MAG: hypothetical protein O8C62_03250 [Candidatus Methanoperedens sp.]|nr:hypothetical protein [Candidatus Methanoperedens sp.]